MTNTVNFNFDVSSNRTDIIEAIKGFMNAFKNDIKVQDNNIQNIDTKEDYDIKKAHEEFFSKYVGMFDDKGFVSDDDIKEIRLKRFSK